MFLLLPCLALSINAPNYTVITVSEFLSTLWNQAANNSENVAFNDYIDANIDYYVVREKGEIPSGVGQTYYYVTGTKEEIAFLEAQLAPLDNATSPNATLFYAMYRANASYYQLGEFWVTITVCLVGVAGLILGFLIWIFDGYDKDPANALLFVTEGNKIVTGE